MTALPTEPQPLSLFTLFKAVISDVFFLGVSDFAVWGLCLDVQDAESYEDPTNATFEHGYRTR